LTRSNWKVFSVFLAIGLALASASGTSRVFASENLPPGPDRYAVMDVEFQSYEWWMVGWSETAVACQIFVDHTGNPTHDDIYNACGELLYKAWAGTRSCVAAANGGDVTTCPGYYLVYVQSKPSTKKVGVVLPPAVVWVTLKDCVYSSSTNICEGTPTLVLTGDEPLPNETITGITVTVDDQEYLCGPICEIELGSTDPQGMNITFWAASSYGDTSEVYDAQVRVAEVGNADQGDVSWYVDVLSSQWRGAPTAGCAETWNSFPPVGGPPAWLSTPDRAENLASNIPYQYLAGNLISQGAVDAGSCPNDGLLADGAASQCGMDVARPAVTEWQNRFDTLIFGVAQDTGVPAQLLKNLFSRESQFWPGVFTTKADVGLGQLTENGADTTLLWNPSFYEQFCPFVLDKATCDTKFYSEAQEDDPYHPALSDKERALLRGALVRSVDAVCQDCLLGIDLRQADFSVGVFAQTLLANCSQTGKIVSNVSGLPTSEAATYEDLWRFTLVNYNAGPGCLIDALDETVMMGEPLVWGSVMTYLTPACQGAIDYVADISR
jgi:hypothetical protein